MIRVRDLELQPDGPRLHLNANIRLVASYQKNPPAPARAAAPANSKPATKIAKMKTTTLILILFLNRPLNCGRSRRPSSRRLLQRANIVTNNAPVTPQMPGLIRPRPLAPAPRSLPSLVTVTTNTASTNNAPPEEIIPAGTINFQGVDVSQVLDVYAQLVGRTVLRAGLPPAADYFAHGNALTKTEADSGVAGGARPQRHRPGECGDNL